MNGSFVEDTAQHTGREPADVDVVTFTQIPVDAVRAEPSLFDPGTNKSRYGVDSYFVDMSAGDSVYLIRRVAYWNSLWSHDREGKWKGYVQVSLSADEDAAARAALDAAANEEAAE